MEIQEKKSLLQKRLANVENPAVLDVIEEILNRNEQKYFDFDKAFSEGYTVEEFRQEIHKRIKSWDWKK